MLCLPNRETNYFYAKGWTGFQVICPSGKSVAAREEAKPSGSTELSFLNPCWGWHVCAI
jgi:hypothetical protein